MIAGVMPSREAVGRSITRLTARPLFWASLLTSTSSGTCDSADPLEGPLTCASGVCDPKDSGCGFANGDGTCTPGSSTTSASPGTA